MDDAARIELEVKLAHQEQALKELSAVLYRQQRQIDLLEKTVKLLKEGLKARAEDAPSVPPLDEKPPHY